MVSKRRGPLSKEQKQQLFDAMLDREAMSLVQQCEKGADVMAPMAGFAAKDDRDLVLTICVVRVVKTFFEFYEMLAPKLEAYFQTHPKADLRSTIRETLRIDADYQVHRANQGLKVPARWDRLVRDSFEAVMQLLIDAKKRDVAVNQLDPSHFTVLGRKFTIEGAPKET